MRPLRWLLLSDLHLGCPGQARVWATQHDFRRSLDGTVAAFGGPPDLVLLSGDLTDAGTPAQFKMVDAFLDQLDKWLGYAPFVVAVPGNHDVARPDARRARHFAFLDNLANGPDDPAIADLYQQLWNERDAAELAPLFAPYVAWLDRRLANQPHPDIKVHRSHFPGDLRVDITLPGVTPLTLVGLNSAWQQYRDGDFHGRLVLSREQFHSALGGPTDDPLAPLKVRHNLLLLHHAPTWLSDLSRKLFLAEVFHPDHIAAAFFGHLHGARSERTATFGGAARHSFQAASFLGRETSRNGPRPRGYAAGTLADDGELRIWPLQHLLRGDGAYAYDTDPAFTCDNQTPYRGSFVLREGARPNKPPVPRALDLACYLARLDRDCAHIKLEGIARAGEAAPYPIEDMYVRLVARNHEGAISARGDARPDLAELLPSHRRLLFAGEPGCGKTTFLRFVAHALVQAHLDRPGAVGRPEVVGLADQGRIPIPVFARVADVMSRQGASALARRALLLDHLAEQTCPEEHLPANGQRDPAWDVRRVTWDERLRRGDAVLLLDGLDEVSEEQQRRLVFEMLDDAMATWPHCRVVVTSRPFSLEDLQRRNFHRETVAPFDDHQIRDYVTRWVAALHADPARNRLPHRDYAEGLLAALRDRREIRRLAENPVMLTCLCVVHWHNEGRLPEGRAEVYRTVIRWLLWVREPKRRAYKKQQAIESMPLDLFEEALAALALAMMQTPGGKRVVVDLDWAAEELRPLMTRYFATDDLPSLMRQLVAWLRFECECSGVLKEEGGGRLKFWHLTFQEYLAAQRLVRTPNAWKAIREHLGGRQWRETIDLYPACLLETGAEPVDALMKRALGLRKDTTKLAAAAEVVGLAGRFLATLQPLDYVLPPKLAATYEALRTRALDIFTVSGAAQVDEKRRIPVAEALGRAGDPRLRPECFRDRLLEVPNTRVRLAKYLVTVEEFARFIDDGGYDHRNLWDDEGWAFREGHKWTEPDGWADQLDTPNRPVVNVSWYEAAAYCRWLSTPDLDLRLPTHDEWLAAAKPDGRRYPWGDRPEPDELCANFGHRVDEPSPVGLYPAGDGQFGHSDLGGNVWEWSADPYPVEVSDRKREDFGLPRWVSGGSYLSPPEGVAAAERLRLWSRDRSRDVGFRVVAEPASP